MFPGACHEGDTATVRMLPAPCLAGLATVMSVPAACLEGMAIPTSLLRILPITMKCPIVCPGGTALREAMASALAGMACRTGQATCRPDVPTRNF